MPSSSRPFAAPRARLLVLAAITLLPSLARAQNGGGFELDRYHPSTAGEPAFMIDRPWYTHERRVAVGVTLDYAHDPLVLARVATDGTASTVGPVVESALALHIDAAYSIVDRLTISASLPLVLHEWGASPSDPGAPSVGVTANGSVTPGDLRLGLMVRLWKHADLDPISIHLGASLWVPLGNEAVHAGDASVRVLPRLVLAGIFGGHLRWSLGLGYLWRDGARLGSTTLPLGGNTAGGELQLGAGLAWTDDKKRWNVGPEALLATVVNNVTGIDPSTGLSATRSYAFDRNFSSVELLIGAQYLFFDALQVGLAIGTGILREPGTPDFRGLLRIAYAPRRSPDQDKDGIVDAEDACPTQAGPATLDPKTTGCPDRDKDTVIDRDDLCPDEPMGPNPDPARRGCPQKDRDKDGVLDSEDACPDVPAGGKPDPARRGCPMDRDGDGVFDEVDQCPDVPAGRMPDPTRPGCPLDSDKDGVPDADDACLLVPQGKVPDPAADRKGCPLDSDKDGVIDEEDVCPAVPQGLTPDAQRHGCPAPDRDGDGVPDAVDACPDKPGAPDPDPKKNGCPGLVQISGCQVRINVPVFFATDKDVILPKSFPVLRAMATALRLTPAIKRIAVDGHTDAMGALAHNMDLSERRAKSVMAFLSRFGKVEADRLEAHGYGPTRPIASNASNKGRAQNRRVEFNILDPACPAQSGLGGAGAAPVGKGAFGKGGRAGKGKAGKRGGGRGKRRR